MNMAYEEIIKKIVGSITITKGSKIYHMTKDENDTNNIYYFHPCESNIDKLEYIFEERYEFTKDIELPIYFSVHSNCRLRQMKYSIKYDNEYNNGYITATITRNGLQLILRKTSRFLKKISDTQQIHEKWSENNDTIYPYYIHNSKVIFSINNKLKSNFEKYIKDVLENNLTNSLIIINNINPIQYFDFDDSEIIKSIKHTRELNEIKLKERYGYVTIYKGSKLYHMMKDTSDNNNIFYFHTSESNVRRLGYMIEERYELTEDIELPILFNVENKCRMRHRFGYAIEFRDNNEIFKYGMIETTPTGGGLQLILKHPSSFLKKISDTQKIKWGWMEDNESIYPFYVNSSRITISMNNVFRKDFNKYIKFHKSNNWRNSLTMIIDKEPIDYFTLPYIIKYNK
jgi:hypothetical protein